jgi:DNA-binding response OmpR family regulator
MCDHQRPASNRLIVDDHAAFRASDGAEAVEAVAALRPEIVLLDIQLPDLDGRLQATPARGFILKSGLSGEALAALTG